MSTATLGHRDTVSRNALGIGIAVGVYAVSFGVPDYLVLVAVRDQAEYERFYMNKMAELPGLARANSQFTMKTVKQGRALPL